MNQPTHCVGLDYGTSTTKIVVRDLEFDEVKAVAYADGRAVVLPSFVAISSDGNVYVSCTKELNKIPHWRFENIKGKILFKNDFSGQILQDAAVISQIENREITDIAWIRRHHRCMLTLKLAYWMSRVLQWSGLHASQVIWSLPLPVSTSDSYYSWLIKDCCTKAIQFVERGVHNKPVYSAVEYLRIFELFRADPSKDFHPQLQTLPEGICNIVACAASSFRRVDRFALADIGASTIEFLSFSLEKQELDVFHSTTLPLGIETLRARNSLIEESGTLRLSADAVADLGNNLVKTLVAPYSIDRKYYERRSTVEFCVCGGGSLIPSVPDAFTSVPRSRLDQFKIPELIINSDLSNIAGYSEISPTVLPRYLVACGLSVPSANFVNYRLPDELATLFVVDVDDDTERGTVMDRYRGPSTDNWDYTVIK